MALKIAEPAPVLTADESIVVRHLANGDETFREKAQVIYFKYLRANIESGRKSNEVNFLSEIFSICPDFMLKKMYRDRIMKENLQ